MKPLLKNQDGAVMLIAVFMAMIAIAALYYLSGLGSAILAQERMQDAADAAAFSSAVIHARGMNILSLINIIMASLLAIVVLLSMLTSLFTWGAKILFAACAVPFVSAFACALIGPTQNAANLFRTATNKIEPMAHKTMDALSKIQEPMRRAIPAMAALNAETLVSERYRPVAQHAISFPILDGLPTTKGRFDKVCDKAGEYAGTLAVMPIGAILDSIGAPAMIRRKLLSAAQYSAKAYAHYYCKNGPKPDMPSTKQTSNIPVLNTAAQKTCQEKKDQDACQKFEEQEKGLLKSYLVSQGMCDPAEEYPQSCIRIKNKARNECNPSTAAETIKSFRWVEKSYTRHFEVQGKGKNRTVIELEPDNIEYRELNKKVDWKNPGPCQVQRMGFNLPEHTLSPWNSSEQGPLCTTIFSPPTLLHFDALRTRSMDKEITEVVDVLRCTQEKTIKAEFEGTQMQQNTKEKKRPQEICSCAELGEQEFQVKSVVYGDAQPFTQKADSHILIANHGQASGVGTLEKLIDLSGKFSVAQAEYYFDDKSLGREEWLWHMKWKARMRRFSMAHKKHECPRQNTCSGRGATNSVQSLTQRLEPFNSILVH